MTTSILVDQLRLLERSGLIRPAEPQPEHEYLFRHALIQDAAYQSLLKSDRGALHRAVAATLEQLYPEQREELSPLLAQHLELGGDERRALDYLLLAGDRAFRLYALAEAVDHYGRALALLRPGDADHPGDPERLLHCALRRGRALELRGDFERALAGYAELEALGQAQRLPALELAALIAQATLRSTTSPVMNPTLGLELSERALALARAQGDRAAEARVLWTQQLGFSFTGQGGHALAAGEAALTLARELDLRDQIAVTLNDLALLFLSLRGMEAGLAAAEEAGVLLREQGNLPLLSDNRCNASLLLWLSGDLPGSHAAGAEALAISRSIGNSWGQCLSLWRLAAVAIERGEFQQGLDLLEQACQLGDAEDLLLTRAYLPNQIAQLYLQLGDLERASAIIVQVEAIFDQLPSDAVSWSHGVRVTAAFQRGDIAEVERLIQEYDGDGRPEALLDPSSYTVFATRVELALLRCEPERARALIERFSATPLGASVRLYHGDVLQLRARIERALGQPEQARVSLLEARAHAEALGIRRLLWQILRDLAELESERGGQEQADQLRQEARAELAALAGSLREPGLRSSFLSQAKL